MSKRRMKCTVKGCNNELWWQGDKVFKDGIVGTRRFYVCGEHLPVDGLSEEWPDRDPRTPISNDYREPE